ncbi:dihydrodipicolinate synthase family protein [Ramlibacter sp. AW1]|uniref:Dihydrodipicolinate synthase family protein n=1 Tax=Ramlibacter aurantiacus TaxID=2801330 RepID=A0A936ZL24_9BURK|nr:dihydrodipicolinate synthase family protein [Ramlibacter aurantiacus]MBL0419200.1 dihydrodipicolinate synthase family protein [Ramlibacter aurantiacus]
MKTPGLIVPPLTPFNDAQQVDYDALAPQIDFIVKRCDAAMVVAAGVEAQEYHFLSLEQRKELVRQTVALVDKRCPVAVGISHPNFRTAIEMAHLAEDIGADAVQLLVPLRPFGGEPTTAEMVAYFESVARETRLPMLLYLNPGPGANVSVAATIELSKLPQVQYVKESSRDLSRVGQLIVEVEKAGHARYYTTMQMLLITLMLGGSGATMPPPGAALANRIVKAFLAGQYEEAARLQLQFGLFPAKWMHRGLTPTLKAAMEILGHPVGKPFPPFNELTADEKAALQAYLSQTDFMKDHANAYR